MTSRPAHAVPPTPDPDAAVGPRHALRLDATVREARWWAVSVLVVATVAAFGWVALLLFGAWIVGGFSNLVFGTDLGGPDHVRALLHLAPGLLVGWCSGLAAVAVFARGETIGPRGAGILSGIVGTLCGAGVLALGPLL